MIGLGRVTVPRIAFEHRYGDADYMGEDRMPGRLVAVTPHSAVVNLDKLDGLYVFDLVCIRMEYEQAA